MHSCVARTYRMCSPVQFRNAYGPVHSPVGSLGPSHLTPPSFNGCNTQVRGPHRPVIRGPAPWQGKVNSVWLSPNIFHTFVSLCVIIMVEMLRLRCDYDLGISVKMLTLTWEQTAAACSSAALITSVSWRNTFRLEGKGTLSLNQRSW